MPKVTEKFTKKQYRSPEAIIRRTEQERQRVNAMNLAFDDLRSLILEKSFLMVSGKERKSRKFKLLNLQIALCNIFKI